MVANIDDWGVMVFKKTKGILKGINLYSKR